MNFQNLQQNADTYVLDKKYLTVHSNDRDINKWPYSNNFEVSLPVEIKNIVSMRLASIVLPSNYYTFSNSYQNTKLTFKLSPIKPPSTAPPALIQAFIYLFQNKETNYTITIKEGYYSPEQLANEIEGLMNAAIQEYLVKTWGGPALFPYSSLGIYNYFRVYYDSVAMKYWFGNKRDNFSLTFDTKITYNVQQCEQKVVWDQYNNWGLPSYLGFEKKTYDTTTYTPTNSIYDNSGVPFYHDDYYWLQPDLSAGYYKSSYFIEAPCTLDIFGDAAIYMEVDRYNNMDELVPYAEATNNMYNNDYNGSVDNAFAKIYTTTYPRGQIFDSTNSMIQSITTLDPPLQQIKKLKFKFRYHDGRLLDFCSNSFNFLIEFNCLHNEQARSYKLRIPPT